MVPEFCLKAFQADAMPHQNRALLERFEVRAPHPLPRSLRLLRLAGNSDLKALKQRLGLVSTLLLVMKIIIQFLLCIYI